MKAFIMELLRYFDSCLLVVWVENLKFGKSVYMFVCVAFCSNCEYKSNTLNMLPAAVLSD